MNTTATRTRTIAATDIRPGDTITYCGATFTAQRIEVVHGGELLMITPAAEDGVCKQAIGTEREVVLVARKNKRSTAKLVHFNQFADDDIVVIKESLQLTETFRTATSCGKKPIVEAFARTASLVTCPACHMAAADYALRHPGRRSR